MKKIIPDILFIFMAMRAVIILGTSICMAACNRPAEKQISQQAELNFDTAVASKLLNEEKRIMDSLPEMPIGMNPINTKNVHPDSLIRFAKKWLHVPYLYASADPAIGFDCSGFISFVFGHFNIDVPRSSIDFTNRGMGVSVADAKTGDLILFTGTDSLIRTVGHMGIVTENTDTLRFIHSTSGKANGVTITTLNDYYRGRFVSVRRIFPPLIEKKQMF